MESPKTRDRTTGSDAKTVHRVRVGTEKTVHQTTIFISHSSGDADVAREVEALLVKAQVRPLLDTSFLGPGHNFVAFMDGALSQADYVLLLWSSNAAKSAYVAAEWQAAFAAEIAARRVFLIVGRLDDQPVPPLLGCRVYVDFREPSRGVATITTMLATDRRTIRSDEKRLGPAPMLVPLVNSTELVFEVYVTSRLFDRTVPISTTARMPGAALLDRVVDALALPRLVHINAAFGVRFDFRLLRGHRPLVPARSLGAQRIRAGDVLTLEATVGDVAHIGPTQMRGSKRVYRGPAPVEAFAFRALQRALVDLGLAEGNGRTDK